MGLDTLPAELMFSVLQKVMGTTQTLTVAGSWQEVATFGD